MGRFKQADSGNWQARAKDFKVGQAVRLTYGGDADEGRVVAVLPAIGMVDVQFPNTNYRLPVEDLQIRNPDFDPFIAPTHEEIPGGVGSAALLPEGATQRPGEQVPPDMLVRTARTVAARHLRKKAIYWADLGRKYRSTRSEFESGQFTCPRCGEILKKTVYKREDGRSVKLRGCPGCMFLIREQDILVDHCAPSLAEEEI